MEGQEYKIMVADQLNRLLLQMADELKEIVELVTENENIEI